MASLIVTYWRDIPSQVTVKAGRKAIDAAAMKAGADKTDDYLADWRRGDPVEVGDDLEAEASAAQARIEAEYDNARLAELAKREGREG